MLTLDDLKDWLHRDLSATDKLLTVLAYHDGPSELKEVRSIAKEAGWSLRKVSNPSQLLSQSKGRAISNGKTWELTEKGKAYLKGKGVPLNEGPSKTTASDLRQILSGIKDQQTADFVEEAIGCCEAHLYRSAVVMSWLAAVHVLRRHVMDDHLSTFNTEMRGAHPKWKDIKQISDFESLKESEFLLRIFRISAIDKSQRKLLEECLDRRNQCGHPSSFKVAENTVRHHIEALILNIFQPLAK